MTAATRRAALGALAAVPAFAFPGIAAAEALGPAGVDPDRSALIAEWHESNRVLEETCEAAHAAGERAKCPAPSALIATKDDEDYWCCAVAGGIFGKPEVDALRDWMALPARPKAPIPRRIIPTSDFDSRANEILSAWDQWQAEIVAAKKREGVAEAGERWQDAIANYHETGRRVAKYPAKTMADVVAKLLAATARLTVDDLDDDADMAITAGAAFDVRALMV